ncbi:uncharacterized protein [Dermacentor andersoni]|uniref:uncharacterized protein isoform X3 n=1 Tax=Dermacentor andersoni TaxID=34620 RepID=UPI003B3A62D6
MLRQRWLQAIAAVFSRDCKHGCTVVKGGQSTCDLNVLVSSFALDGLQMPRRFTGKLFQFLFRHLELGTFGERLRWLDRESGIFQLLWKHGNGSSVTPEEDFALFLAWHRLKVRRKPCDGTEAKQRFRAATSKMRLERVKNWQGVFPEKNFQFRRFPKDDLEYLFKHVDLDREIPESKKRLKLDSMPPLPDMPDMPDTPDSCPSMSPAHSTSNPQYTRPSSPDARLLPSGVVVKIEPPDDPPDDPPDYVPDYLPIHALKDCMPGVLHYSPSTALQQWTILMLPRHYMNLPAGKLKSTVPYLPPKTLPQCFG